MEGGAWMLFQIGEEVAMKREGNKGKEGKAELCFSPFAAFPQDPEVLSLGNPGLDINQAPSWPGLRTLLQQLPPQDSDVGLPLPSFPLSCLPFFTYRGKKFGPKGRGHAFKA